MRGSRLLVVVLLAALVLSMLGPTALALPSAVGVDHVPGQIVVGLRNGVALDARVLGVQTEAEQVDEVPTLNAIVLQVAPQAEQAVLKALQHNPNVEFAEPNYIATIDVVPNDTYVSSPYNSSHSGAVSQWAWAKIQAYQAWDVTTGSASAKIAVVDTGIDNANPDLPAVVLQKDFINNDNNAEDDNGHGTHVAGTIGARTNNGSGVAGMNWNVSLMAAKVLNNTGSGAYSAVANGITWAADNGAKVINLSLGGPASTLLQNAITYAWNKGAVLACAAGNSGSSAKSYPGAYTQCIAVAATDQNDAKASFSNYGNKWVDVAAPGVAILSTTPDTSVYLNTQYGYYKNFDALNGTSMATPHVAGLAGLVWAKGACTTNTCVRNKIESTADKISGTGKYWAYGRINAYNAVK